MSFTNKLYPTLESSLKDKSPAFEVSKAPSKVRDGFVKPEGTETDVANPPL